MLRVDGASAKLLNNKAVSKELSELIKSNCPNLTDAIDKHDLAVNEKGQNGLQLEYSDVLRYNNDAKPDCSSLDFVIEPDGSFSLTCNSLRRDIQSDEPSNFLSPGAFYSTANTINRYGKAPVLCNTGEKTVTDFCPEPDGSVSIATRKLLRRERQLQEKSYASGNDLTQVHQKYEEMVTCYDKNGTPIMTGKAEANEQNTSERNGIFGGREERGTINENKNYNARKGVTLEDSSKECSYFAPKNSH